MRPGSLNRRKAAVRAQKQHNEYISEIRKSAVSNRGDRQEVSQDLREEWGQHENHHGLEIPSDRTVRRLKADLQQLLPPSRQIQCEVLAKHVQAGLCNKLSVVKQKKAKAVTSKWTLSHYYSKTEQFLLETKSNYGSFAAELLLNWAQDLISSDRYLFASVNLTFLNTSDIPTPVLAQLQADAIRKDLMSNMRYKMVRDMTTTLTIRVVKELQVWKKHQFGEVTGLAKAVGTTRKFAAKVLTAVKRGKEVDLYKRKPKRNSLRGTEVMVDLVEFLQQERNSRPCPGQTVSVAYHVRRDKYLLLDSKHRLASLFLKEHPQYQYKSRAILHAWPKNFKTPSARDRRRNVCPIHSNFERLHHSLVSRGIACNIALSCRAACSLAMCDRDGVESQNPLTWNYDCAMGVCTDCPDLLADVKDHVDANSTVDFTQWKKGSTSRTSGPAEIFGLFNVTLTVLEAIELLKMRVVELKSHIFVAYNQWRAKKLCEEHLDTNTLMLVVDYQQNLTVELSESTTTTVFGGNSVQIGQFPVVVFFRRSTERPVEKASITFFTDDLGHDHQQVQAFEQRVVDIIRDKTGCSFFKVVIFSDGCSAQFKSRFCNADLCELPVKVLGMENGSVQLEDGSVRVEAHYFASHEGKSDSGTIISLSVKN